MKVKVLAVFNDSKGKKIRQAGEEFETSKERFKEINSTKHGVMIEEIKEEKKSK